MEWREHNAMHPKTIEESSGVPRRLAFRPAVCSSLPKASPSRFTCPKMEEVLGAASGVAASSATPTRAVATTTEAMDAAAVRGDKAPITVFAPVRCEPISVRITGERIRLWLGHLHEDLAQSRLQLLEDAVALAFRHVIWHPFGFSNYLQPVWEQYRNPFLELNKEMFKGIFASVPNLGEADSPSRH